MSSGPATWDGHPRCLSPKGGDVVATKAAMKCPSEPALLVQCESGFSRFDSIPVLKRLGTEEVLLK